MNLDEVLKKVRSLDSTWAARGFEVEVGGKKVVDVVVEFPDIKGASTEIPGKLKLVLEVPVEVPVEKPKPATKAPEKAPAKAPVERIPGPAKPAPKSL